MGGGGCHLLDRLQHGQPFGEACCDGGRQGAPGAVAVARPAPPPRATSWLQGPLSPAAATDGATHPVMNCKMHPHVRAVSAKWFILTSTHALIA